MKITLIYPSFGEKLKAIQMEPLTMAVLAGLTPKDIDISFYDDRIEDIPYDEPTDLAAISVQTFMAKRAYQIAAQYRRRKIPVILGGFHPTFVPEEVAQYADAVAIGEVENIWKDILEDCKNGRLKKLYKADKPSLLKGIKPDRSIFDGKRYVPIRLVEFGRGCRHSCNFCSVSTFFNHRKTCRPVSEVVEEIKGLGTKNILFVDDNLISDIPRAKELFKALIPLKINWITQAGIEIASDGELLKLAAESGCFGLLIGFESLDEKNLQQMKKSGNPSIEYYREGIKKIYRYGIKICASFVLGYDYDTEKTFEEILHFSLQEKFILALFNNLTPFPGAPLYYSLKDEKRLLYDKWWLEPNLRWGDVVFKPKHMSPSDLQLGCRKNRYNLYSFKNIVKRLPQRAHYKSPLLYFIINYVNSKDVREKQGFLLGRKNEQIYC